MPLRLEPCGVLTGSSWRLKTLGVRSRAFWDPLCCDATGDRKADGTGVVGRLMELGLDDGLWRLDGLS